MSHRPRIAKYTLQLRPLIGSAVFVAEEVFGWLKTVGNFRKTRYIGLGANQVAASLLASAYNVLRIAKLLEAP